MANEALKKLLERMKKLAENALDEETGQYRWDCEYLYTRISNLIQSIEMDEEDKKREGEEE